MLYSRDRFWAAQTLAVSRDKEASVVKKIISMLLTAVMITSALPTFASQEENTASIVFDAQLASFPQSMIKTVKMGATPAVTLTKCMLRNCWQLKSANANSSYILVDIAEGFLDRINDGTYVEIEVDYFDRGEGVFSLEYDSQLKGNKETDGVYLTNSEKWKTHTFKIDDAYFGNRDMEGDFAIRVRSSRLTHSAGNVHIGEIRVTKYPMAKPVQCLSLTTEELGNIFGNNDEVKFTADIKSYSDKNEKVKITATAYDERGLKEWTYEEEAELAPKETLTKEIKPDIKRYCLYDMEVKVEGEGFSQSKTVPFSHINNISDGTKNEYSGYCTHLTNPGYDPEEGIELVEKSGASFIRQSVQWQVVDPPTASKYSYSMPELPKRMLKALGESNIKWQWLVGMGNTKYGMPTTMTVPTEQEQYEAFNMYLDYMLKQIKDNNVKIHSYEIWNEPNIQSFNTAMTDGMTLAKFEKSVAEHLRKADPDTDIAVGSICNVSSQSAKNYLDELSLGLSGEDWLQLSLHPYNHASSPEKGTIQSIPEYIDAFATQIGADPTVYITEFGYYSGGKNATKDTRVQAEYNVRTYVYLKANDMGDCFSWYDLTNDGGVENYSENNFGHCGPSFAAFEHRYAAKESFAAITFLNKVLQNADATAKVYDDNTAFAYMYNRPKDNKNILTVWANGQSQLASFKLDSNEATLYDIYGNAKTLYSDDGIFTVKLSDSMQYIEGDFQTAEYVPQAFKSEVSDLTIAKGCSETVELDGLDEACVVKAEGTDGVKIDYVDNTAVKFTHCGDLEHNEKIFINIFKNDKLLTSYDLTIKPEDIFDSSIMAFIRDSSNVSLWDAVISIENNDTQKPLNAVIKFKEPSFLAKNYSSISVPTIPAQCTGEIKVKLPRINELGMYDVVYTIESENKDIREFKKNVDFTCAVRTDTPPEIDGVMSTGEWETRATMKCDSAERVSMLGNNIWKGASDLSEQTNIMVDNENLYMFVKVEDDIHSATSVNELIWQNDSVQFGFAFEKTLTDAMVGGTFTEISFGDTPDGTCVWRHSSEGNNLPTGKVENAQLAVKRINGETHYEFKIPWSEITVRDVNFDNISTIGFSMIVNDNDGNGRKGWIEYASGIARAKDTSLFTYLSIAK